MTCHACDKSKKFDSVIGVIREKEKQPLRKLHGAGSKSDVEIFNNWHTIYWKNCFYSLNDTNLK